MPVIDSDTHVDETDETWEYLADSDQQYRPVTVTQEVAGGSDGTPRGYNRYWVIDGKLRLATHTRRPAHRHGAGPARAHRCPRPVWDTWTNWGWTCR